jgi:hypothetical protein
LCVANNRERFRDILDDLGESADARRGMPPTVVEIVPFHKPGACCAAGPRCWRSRRTAISLSYPIEQTMHMQLRADD